MRRRRRRRVRGWLRRLVGAVGAAMEASVQAAEAEFELSLRKRA